jgi:hypothetical protein
MNNVPFYNIFIFSAFPTAQNTSETSAGQLKEIPYLNRLYVKTDYVSSRYYCKNRITLQASNGLVH